METNTNPASNYEYAGPKETQRLLKEQFGQGAKKAWEQTKNWARSFVSAFKTVGVRFWKGLMYVATRVIEVAGTCIMAVPAILASTAKLVFGILKWTASLIVAGVVIVVAAVTAAFAFLGKGFIKLFEGVEYLFGKAAVKTWNQTKKVGRSRKMSDNFKTVKETVNEGPTAPNVGPQTQAA